MKEKRTKLYIDQYGGIHYAKTVKELQTKLGGRVTKMYTDIDGKTYDIGYVIGQLWLSRYDRDMRLV